MSTFTVPVIRINKLDKHPNADTLSITEVEGCPVICKTSEFKLGDLAVYIPIDAVVPTTKEVFAFLATKEGQQVARIKAKRLRGVFSMGFLLPNTWGFSEGQDVQTQLGVVKYEEPELPAQVKLGGECAKPPKVKENRQIPQYDMESYRKYKYIFDEFPTQDIIITEKIHGSNFRSVFFKGKLHVGSHRTWRKQNLGENDIYWRMASQYNLEEKLKKFPNYVFYGEVYGSVQDLHYGVPDGACYLAIFDILDVTPEPLWKRFKAWVTRKPLPKSTKWLDWPAVRVICTTLGLPTVPELYIGPYSQEKIESLCSGKTTLGGGPHIREGVVVKCVYDQRHKHYGRVIMKLVSPEYLLRKGGTEFH